MTDPETEKVILPMFQLILQMHQDIIMIKMETANIHRVFNKVKEEEPAKNLSKRQQQKQDLEHRMMEEKLQVIKKLIQS